MSEYQHADGSIAHVYETPEGWRIDFRTPPLRGGRADSWTPTAGPIAAHHQLTREGYTPRWGGTAGRLTEPPRGDTR